MLVARRNAAELRFSHPIQQSLHVDDLPFAPAQAQLPRQDERQGLTVPSQRSDVPRPVGGDA